MDLIRCAAAAVMVAASFHTADAGAFVTPQLLLSYSSSSGSLTNVIDFRPAINADASRIVFERQVQDGESYSNQVVLFTSSLNQPQPQPLIKSQQFPLGSPSTRPDWCQLSSSSPIVYSVPSGGTAPAGVFSIVPDGTSAAVRISDNPNWIYPTWFPDCQSLAVDATKYLAYGPNPPPNTDNPGPATLHSTLR